MAIREIKKNKQESGLKMRALAIINTLIDILFFFIAPIFLSLFGVKNSFMTYFFTVILYSGGVGIAPFALHVLFIVINSVILWNMHKNKHTAKQHFFFFLFVFISNNVVFFIIMQV